MAFGILVIVSLIGLAIYNWVFLKGFLSRNKREFLVGIVSGLVSSFFVALLFWCFDPTVSMLKDVKEDVQFLADVSLETSHKDRKFIAQRLDKEISSIDSFVTSTSNSNILSPVEIVEKYYELLNGRFFEDAFVLQGENRKENVSPRELKEWREQFEGYFWVEAPMENRDASDDSTATVTGTYEIHLYGNSAPMIITMKYVLGFVKGQWKILYSEVLEKQ